jgi:shikimate kinase
VFIDPRTRELLNERAITIWLDAPVDLLTGRTGRLETRPLLKNVNDRKATLERLAVERRELYAQAHLHVKSGNGAHGEVVESIVEALEKHLNGAASKPNGG